MALHFRAIAKTLGIISLLLALFYCIPVLSSLILHDGYTRVFAFSFVFTLLIGLALYMPYRHTHDPIRRRDIYLIVSFAWLLVSLLGMTPYVLSGLLGPVDAFFETVSGFTTTGATILTDIEAFPPSMHIWRALTQWVGGMGIVVLMIAIMPLLGVGGMKLFDAESPGPMIDRVKPRVKETALIMWIVYASLTVTAFVLLLIGGLSIYDALVHAFTTLGSGGFSTREASIGAFSPYVQYVVIFFMILTCTNYALLYAAVRGNLKPLRLNDEFRAYIGLLLGAATIVVSFLLLHGGQLEASFRHGLFQVVSIMTGTGFTTFDYTLWAEPVLYTIFALMFIGGMTGSTAGGVKVMRHVLLVKGLLLEFRKQLHPDAILRLRFNGHMVAESLLHRVLAFMILYVITGIVGVGVLLLAGVHADTALGAVAATLGNIGPGLGAVGPAGSYAFFGDGIKLFLSFLMIVGRLELFTVLILFTPYFWRKY